VTTHHSQITPGPRTTRESPGRSLEITCHHEGDTGQNLITIVGNMSSPRFLDYVYGDEKGKGEHGELFRYIDENSVCFSMICDGVRRFTEMFGKSKRYHIELVCDHSTREFISLEVTIHDGRR
jgi:hypothetical protein